MRCDLAGKVEKRTLDSRYTCPSALLHPSFRQASSASISALARQSTHNLRSSAQDPSYLPSRPLPCPNRPSCTPVLRPRHSLRHRHRWELPHGQPRHRCASCLLGQCPRLLACLHPLQLDDAFTLRQSAQIPHRHRPSKLRWSPSTPSLPV